MRAARKPNAKFILEQRAEMRSRLVQLAIGSKLKYGHARLAGFSPSTAVEVVDEAVENESDSDSVFEMV